MNTIHLLGRIGRDPEIKTLQSGATVTEFSLATSEQWKDKEGNKQERTDWHNIVFWGKGGEVVAQYLKKGDPVQITGSMTYEKWQDKEGNNRITAKVKASNFEFVPAAAKGEQGAKEYTPPPASPAAAPTPEGDKDLPF